MANQEHLDILAKGVETWNAWRDGNPDFRPDLTGADLTSANLGGANLCGADLRGADLSLANLTGAMLSGADLSLAVLSRADLTRAGLERANLTDVNLRLANLTGATLLSANLDGTNLTRANLNNANLIKANLNSANLIHADLDGANLHSANLSNAKLSDAKLNDAILHSTILHGAKLVGTNFTGAITASTLFGNVDLSTVRGLDEVVHWAPSTISLDTIYLSQGKIPDVFLRRCGVPDKFITYMRSLTGNAFDFYSCFISYSTNDQEFADRLYADLQARGVRCWFAPHHIQGGRKIHEQIDEAIKVYDKLLLILSDASMSSTWVKTEIANARAKEEQQKRQMLFPIALVPYNRIKTWKLFDADNGIDSARDPRVLRARFLQLEGSRLVREGV
jgi:uncharacterized protein YjbI with pentapeptide repeats